MDKKEYNKKYRDTHKDEIKKYNKEYRERNKDKVKFLCDKWREENKERTKEYTKEYTTINKEKILDAAKNNYKKNRRKILNAAKEGNKLYYERNKKEIRRKTLVAKYGITDAEWNSTLLEQNGVCAICGKKPKKNRRLCVDHNHNTGKVRGLLCDTCNHGLGQFYDSTELLGKAILYIEKE